MRFEPRPVVRVGLIGYGGRGTSLLHDLLGIPSVEVNAVCDLVKERVERAQAAVEQAGQKRPAGYAAGETDFENLVRRDDLDVVYIATPWRWHVPMAVAAMQAGKHALVEVPAATTLPDCWRLVEASERTRRHCVMTENCCFGYNELMVLGMVRAGLLGELTHAEAAYIHDLRDVLFDDHEGLWRRDEHFSRNGNIYPTHGLGPVAGYLDINRGDRFAALVFGPLNCQASPTPVPGWLSPVGPYSLTVDRSGSARVLYTSGEIFAVDVADASCAATTFQPQQGNSGSSSSKPSPPTRAAARRRRSTSAAEARTARRAGSSAG